MSLEAYQTRNYENTLVCSSLLYPRLLYLSLLGLICCQTKRVNLASRLTWVVIFERAIYSPLCERVTILQFLNILGDISHNFF